MTYQLNRNAVTSPPPPRPAAQALRGDFISLLPLGDSGDCFDELYRRSHGDAERESIWEFLPYGPFANADAMRDCYLDMGSGGDPSFYTVHHRQDDACAGIVSYLRIKPDAWTIEIGHIWHARDRQRGAANTEAVFLLAENVFSLGYRRLEWKCNALNMRSRQAALRLGFAFEGVFRQHLVTKGQNRDTAWFAILADDWRQARENFICKLSSAADARRLGNNAGEQSLAELNRPLVAWSLAAHDGWK